MRPSWAPSRSSSRGRENEVPGLRRIQGDEIRDIEPHATGIAALHSPATGVVDFAEVAASYGRDLADYEGFLRARGRNPLDATGDDIRDHLADLAQRGMAASTSARGRSRRGRRCQTQ